MTRKKIEERFKVRVVDDSFYNPMIGRIVRQYRIYSADGCQWENGLRTLAAVERECREWEVPLKEIAEKTAVVYGRR